MSRELSSGQDTRRRRIHIFRRFFKVKGRTWGIMSQWWSPFSICKRESISRNALRIFFFFLDPFWPFSSWNPRLGVETKQTPEWWCFTSTLMSVAGLLFQSIYSWRKSWNSWMKLMDLNMTVRQEGRKMIRLTALWYKRIQGWCSQKRFPAWSQSAGYSLMSFDTNWIFFPSQSVN